jgi:hypothetical protein
MTSKNVKNSLQARKDIEMAKEIHDKAVWAKIYKLLQSLRMWLNEVQAIREGNTNNNNNNARSMNTRFNAMNEKIERHWKELLWLLDTLFLLWQKLGLKTETSRKLHAMLMECQKALALEPYDNAVRDAFYDPYSRRHAQVNSYRTSQEERLAWRLEKALMTNCMVPSTTRSRGGSSK